LRTGRSKAKNPANLWALLWLRPKSKIRVPGVLLTSATAALDRPRPVLIFIKTVSSKTKADKPPVPGHKQKGEGHLDATSPPVAAGLSRVKLFLALSRTPHGLLDLATPALAALLWYGGVPSLEVTVVGLITVFAGYTAVYALNDVVDFRVDQEKLKASAGRPKAGYLDALFMRHPMAQGQVSFGEGLVWTVAWATMALLGAYHLNPVCAYIFLAGCALEAVYCLLLRVSHFRTLVSGLVKTLGGVAAVFAVDPHPAPWFLVLLVLWLFCWEIGGQNIPADWHDVEEDQSLGARTMPVHYGPEESSAIVLGTLASSVIFSAVLVWVSPLQFKPGLVGLAVAVGGYFLLVPALRLYRTKAKEQAAALFNRASYYPLAMLSLALVNMVV
jgi:4-hydroxybenzoate polyprenyltransferase